MKKTRRRFETAPLAEVLGKIAGGATANKVAKKTKKQEPYALTIHQKSSKDLFRQEPK